MIKRIFIDLDDVLNQFSMHALQMLGCPVTPGALSKYDPKWGFDLTQAANALHEELYFDTERLWSELNGPDVWAQAPKSKEFWPLLNFCEAMVGRKNICILTSSVSDPECLSGKAEWIQRHCPRWLHRQFLVGPQKHLLARVGRILIDDSDENVEMFRKHGGEAVLFPRPWNTLHAKYKEPLVHVFMETVVCLERMRTPRINEPFGFDYWLKDAA